MDGLEPGPSDGKNWWVKHGFMLEIEYDLCDSEDFKVLRFMLQPWFTILIVMRNI